MKNAFVVLVVTVVSAAVLFCSVTAYKVASSAVGAQAVAMEKTLKGE